MEATTSSRCGATVLVLAICVVAAMRDRDPTPVRTVTELVSVVNYTPSQESPSVADAQVLALAPSLPPAADAPAPIASEAADAAPAAVQALQPAAPRQPEIVMAAVRPAAVPPRLTPRAKPRGPHRAVAASPRPAKSPLVAATCTGAECRKGTAAEHSAPGRRKPLALHGAGAGEPPREPVPRFLMPLRNFGLYLKQKFDPDGPQTVAGSGR